MKLSKAVVVCVELNVVLLACRPPTSCRSLSLDRHSESAPDESRGRCLQRLPAGLGVERGPSGFSSGGDAALLRFVLDEKLDNTHIESNP